MSTSKCQNQKVDVSVVGLLVTQFQSQILRAAANNRVRGHASVCGYAPPSPTYNKCIQCCHKGDVTRLSLRTILCRITLRDSAALFINLYACFLINILHVGKSRVANMRLALQSLGRKVIFLKTLLYATHNFRNDSER